MIGYMYLTIHESKVMPKVMGYLFIYLFLGLLATGDTDGIFLVSADGQYSQSETNEVHEVQHLLKCFLIPRYT